MWGITDLGLGFFFISLAFRIWSKIEINKNTNTTIIK